MVACLCGFDEGGFGDSSTPSVVTAETASERNSLNDRHHTTVFTELHRGVKTLQKKLPDREQTVGSYRELTKRSTPNYCFHSNLRRPHCLLFVLCTDVDNTQTLQAILSKRPRPYNRLHPSPVIRSKGVPWCSMNDFHTFKYHCWPS